MCNCDNCDAPAIYRIDGADFCEQCAKNYLLDLLSEETVESLADILETRIEWGYIDTIIE